MDDERYVAGMPVLDRQAHGAARRVDARGRALPPSRVAERRPTPLQDLFIPLSVVVLLCGIVAISALELGTPARDLVVKVPVLVGGMVLAIVTADAIVRIWRSAWAWMPIDAGRAAFRFVWVATLVSSLALLALAGALVVSA